MVDGTTIPIFEKPHHYWQAFYDRKSRYSINAQIINTPNRQIIDYATGFNGSRHDTHCFRSTNLGKNPEDLLPNGEWCWGDIGYPLTPWLIIPYKERHKSKENRDFNYALSKVRIRSEHAIGYLKGRFQSLKELRIRINNAQDMSYASCWIQACIVLHAFALDMELETDEAWLEDGVVWERQQRENDRRQQLQDEIELASTNREDVSGHSSTRQRDRALREGKLRREQLKQHYFRTLRDYD